MDIGTIALTKKTMTFRVIKQTPTCAAIQVERDGAVLTTGERVYRIKPQQGVRHAIGSKPAVGLSDDEAAALTAAIDAATTALRAAYDQTPDGQRASLFRERERLTDAVADAWDRWERARERAFDADTGLGFPTEDAIETAKRAVAAFDAAHPEIKAALDAQRETERQRSIRAAEWN